MSAPIKKYWYKIPIRYKFELRLRTNHGIYSALGINIFKASDGLIHLHMEITEDKAKTFEEYEVLNQYLKKSESILYQELLK